MAQSADAPQREPSEWEPSAANPANRTPEVMTKASIDIIEALTAARNYVSASLLNLQAASPNLTRQRDAMGLAMAQLDRCTEAAHLIRDLAQSAARRGQHSNSTPE